MTLAVSLMAGCKWGKKDKDGNPIPKQSKQQANSNNPPDMFERSDDPPLQANTRFAAGQLAESQGDLERAMMQYREALKIDPNHRASIFRLGSVLTAQKRYPEAIGVWQQYIKATRGSSAAYNNLAYCYEQAGRLADAEAAFRTGIERDPGKNTCRVNYGLMLARHDRIDDAVAQLQMALSPAEVNYNLGSVMEQMGRRDQAKGYYQKALELDPRLADARQRLAALK